MGFTAHSGARSRAWLNPFLLSGFESRPLYTPEPLRAHTPPHQEAVLVQEARHRVMAVPKERHPLAPTVEPLTGMLEELWW
jgi:hypothetical protein